MDEISRRFLSNISGHNYIYYRLQSQQFFKICDTSYDFIYIDGDHRNSTVLTDAVLSFNHLKSNGIIAFDDYLWERPKAIDGPKLAIDSFLECFKDKIEILEKDYQVWIRKL